MRSDGTGFGGVGSANSVVDSVNVGVTTGSVDGSAEATPVVAMIITKTRIDLMASMRPRIGRTAITFHTAAKSAWQSRFVLVRGSRIVITGEGLLELSDGKGIFMRPPSLRLGERTLEIGGYQQVHDLAVAGDRVVAIVEGDEPGNLPYHTLAITTLAFEQLQPITVPKNISRAAITDAAIFLASADAVIVHEGGRNIHASPFDLACTRTELAVLDANGVTFFDAHGNPRGNVRLFAPTAIAVDRIEPGWLVAIDGGVFHLDGPNDTPRRIASFDEPIDKVRRSSDAVYVLVGDEVIEIKDEHVWHMGHITHDDDAEWWNDFDAGPEGLAMYADL